jgi:hypothetical protein
MCTCSVVYKSSSSDQFVSRQAWPLNIHVRPFTTYGFTGAQIDLRQ